MNNDLERNLGKQPLADLLETRGISHHDLVNSAPGGVTHKMVTRACKGRRLTPHSKRLIQDAVNQATGEVNKIADLFNY